MTEEFKNYKPVSDYTKEDFLTGTEPYEYCCAFIDDPFEFERAKARVTEQAAKLKIRSFMTLLGNYCRKYAKNLSETFTATNFPMQPVQLICGNYICDYTGVSLDGETVCPHPIMPIMRLCNIDTGVEKIKIAYSRGGRAFRYLIVDRKTISSANKIVDLSDSGIAVTSESAKALVKYFAKIEQLNPELLPETECVTRMGWITQADEQLDFAPYIDSIAFDGEAEYKKHYDSVKAVGDVRKWYEVIYHNIRLKSVAARMVFASSLASVLVKPLGCNCFWVHLWGETESAKTVLAMTAASIWGNPEIGDYIMTFNATTVGMEKTAAFYNNLPYILDELQIINDKRDLDNLIYMLTEGSGRSRGNKLGGLDAVPKWKNAVITTGERPITTARSGGGSVNRVIEIECKEKFFDDPRHVANTVKANYGAFGKMFVQKLIKDGFGHAEELFDSYQKKLIADYDIMQKQAQSAALILTADTLMCEMLGVEETALKTEEVAEFLKTKASVSVNPRAYEHICSFVALNSTRFVYNPDKPIDQWGVLPGDKQSVYIAVPVFRKVCEEEGYNSQALLSYLRDNRLIELDKAGKNSVNKKVNGLSTRCIHMTLPAENDDKYDDIEL
jgi:hypothetical protein